jgi:hypothetical protein
MNLTKEQIATIQTSLSGGSIFFFYADIKAELVDHIAAEIESELSSDQSFESLLHERLRHFNQKKFQRQILLKTHLGMIQALFNQVNSFGLVLKVIMMTIIIGSCATLFSHADPFFSEKILKISFIIVFLVIAFLAFFQTRLLKNAQIIAAGNTLFMIGMLSQFVLQLEWLQ